MPRSFAYEPVLSSKGASFLIGLSKSKQRTVIALMFQLAEHPYNLEIIPREKKTDARSNT